MKIHLPRWSVVRLFKPKVVYYPNRRIGDRILSRNLLRCLRSDDTPHEIIANLVNLSETGVQFFSTHPMTVGSLLKMVINLAEEDRQINATAKVIWIGKIHGQKIYRIGAAFLSLAMEDREMIRRFVKTISSSR